VSNIERTSVTTRQLRVVGDVDERAVPTRGGSVARPSFLEDAGTLLAGNAHGPGAIP
jgi:hypothetical protein